MGFDYATISDHVVIPKDIAARYPYTRHRRIPGRRHGWNGTSS